MEVLLTFVGYHDPYYKGPLENEELKGPILYLLSLKSFDRVILFTTPNTIDITRDTSRAIQKSFKQMDAEMVDCDIEDPTDYGQILSSIRNKFKVINSTNAQNEYYIATASGTPQMHASWLMLSASGEIPARILQTRPPQFVTAKRQAVDEIDPLSPCFPRIRATETLYEQEELRKPEISHIIEDMGIIGKHPSLETALDRAALFAEHTSPILIQGETGTGKELIARLIHRLSGRPLDKFVTINCAALPETLAESILFGHKTGAFTGAVSDQDGKFVMANGGTLFLDEISELSSEVQSKMLRVLQDGVVEAIGASSGKKVDVQIIAATNKDLKEEVDEGRFREDIYYRIVVGLINLPPLRDRRSDIPLIALFGIDNINKRLKKPKRLSQGAIQKLMQHHWPGNVRNLLNLLERSSMVSRKEVIEVDDLIFIEYQPETYSLLHLPEPEEGFNLDEFLNKTRSNLIHKALDLSDWNKSAAARRLGMTPQAIHNFLKREIIGNKNA